MNKNKKKGLLIAVVCILLAALILFVKQPDNTAVNTAEASIVEIEKFGNAMLDVTADELDSLGFDLGDVVEVTVGENSIVMPYFNGFYTDIGEYLLRLDSSGTNIKICINHGSFADETGAEVGDSVIIRMAEKEGELKTQISSALTYTDSRDDYASDEIFANFRPVTSGNIAEGKLYRSASPINNYRGRASYADKLAKEAGINTVVNLADTDEEIAGYIESEDFDSEYYKGLWERGSVIALAMGADLTSDEFKEGLAKGLTFIADNEAPYLFHCNEGKDRAGFTAVVLDSLMGASLEEVIENYMTSFYNYYGITYEESPEKYNAVLEKNLISMVRIMASADEEVKLEDINLLAAAEDYLISCGMSKETIMTLKEKLS